MIHHIEGGYANTYLIEGKEGLTAVDVGSNLAAEMIQKIITEQYDGKSGDTETHKLPPIFTSITIGGIARLKELFPEAEINFFHMVEKIYLRGGAACDSSIFQMGYGARARYDSDGAPVS